MQFQPQTSTRVVARDLVIPLAIWALLFAFRDVLTQTWCATTPTPCVIEAVNALDRLAFKYGSVRADFASNVFQNVVGTAIFLFPFALAFRRKISYARAYIDSLGFLLITVWNMAIMESVRALVQRPRPLVFRSPLEDGANFYQYNSFYSGHTSFMALITLSLYFYVLRIAPERKNLHRALLAVSISFTVIMACLRIVGGRHYPTDTIGGACFGWAVATLVSQYLVYREDLKKSVDLPTSSL